MTKCGGFGEFRGCCTNQEGSTHSPHWCQRCDDLRRSHINKQLNKLTIPKNIEELLNDDHAKVDPRVIELKRRLKIAGDALQKIHMIRCHIVAGTNFHWSRDMYPLVAILEEVNIEGVNPKEAKEILESCDCIFCRNRREA